jgi:hypothetical protein
LLHNGKTRAFGYRFESPEGPGSHHYYHAQSISGFERDEPFLNTASWLPTGCPTFPLDANHPVKLLLSLLIALYGISYISRINPYVPGISVHLNEMRFQNLPELKWHRKVITDTGRVCEIHDTLNPAEFEKVMKAKYPKCEIVGITKGIFDQSRRASRRQ